MKILYLINSYNSFLQHRKNLVDHASKDHQVSIILPLHDVESNQSSLNQLNYPVLTIELSRKGINPIQELKTLWQIYKIYQSESPDLCHNFTIKSVIYGTIAARMAGVKKIVNSITGLGYSFSKKNLKAKLLEPFIKTLYRLCLRSRKVQTVFQNQDDQSLFIKNKLVIPNQTTLIPGSGVDTEYYQPSTEETDPPIILFCSRLLWSKGFKELIEATKILQQKNINFKLQVLGDLDPGNPDSLDENDLIPLGKLDYAQLLGFKRDVLPFYQQAAIVTLPSNYREGISMSTLQGMATSKPLVVTNVPGAREVVQENVNGIIVEPNNPEELASAFERLLLDKKMRQEMGLKGRELAISKYSKDIINKMFLDLYEKF